MKTPLGLFRFRRSTLTAAALFVLVLLFLLFYPFQTTIVPEWSLRVVDEEGAVVRDVNVTEHWQHFLLESSSHEDVRRVAENGVVSFPERTIRSSLVSRGLATIGRIKRDGWRARRSPAASVVVWGNPSYATTVEVYVPSKLPQSHVMVPTIR
jgi:hypothetical protein